MEVMTSLNDEQRTPGWYIDSWASLDGLIFASEHDDTGNVNTVFLSPPYWSAVAISNRATAWAATRGTFQDGYYTADGDEIRFNTLEEIREIARRGYLSGGYGLLPPTNNDGAPVLGRDAGGIDEPEGWSRLSKIMGSVVSDTNRLDLSTALKSFYGRSHGWEACRTVVGAFVTDALEMYDQMFAGGSGNRAARADFSALLRTGMAVFGFDEVYRWCRAAHRHPVYDYGWFGENRSQLSSVMQLVFRLPIARGRRLETIGDHLVLAASSREFLGSLRSSVDFLPVLVGALFICGSNDVLPNRRWMAVDHLEEACDWIAANVPGVIAPDHPAAVEMERFIGRIREQGPTGVRPTADVAAAVT